jgi:uncharacterized protein YcbK (DUF882 family)
MLLSRRSFLRAGALAAVSACAPGALAVAKEVSAKDRSLAFYNTHTGERLRTVFWAEGAYIQESLQAINRILRDSRNDQVHEIDPRLIDLLYVLRSTIDAREPFHVISGYRSPATNALLRSRSTGVAENSLHLVGKAIDIRVPGRKLIDVRNAALSLKAGGVGYYSRSDFVHVDIGRVRFW